MAVAVVLNIPRSFLHNDEHKSVLDGSKRVGVIFKFHHMSPNKPEIKLLCPPKKCGKCRRMISRVESILEQLGIVEEIQIVNDPDELLQYPTWVLPTLLINGQVVARGYIPSTDAVRKALEEE